MGVPEIVTAAPGVNVFPAIRKSPALSAVITDPANVSTGRLAFGVVPGLNAIVLSPNIISEACGARDIGVPEIVTSLPGFNVSPAIRNSEALLAVITDPSNVNASGVDATLFIGSVLSPMITADADGAKETGVPDTTISEPGSRVCDPNKNCDAALAVIVSEPNVMTGS